MKILIYGAGSVGHGLATYLASGENDIIVMDVQEELLCALSEKLDIQTVKGRASYPSLMKQIDAKSVDIFIAVSNDDEDNMVACQVAKHLFQIPLTISYLYHAEYIQGLQDIYGENPPIDHVITPELAVAQEIVANLQISGCTSITQLDDAGIEMVGLSLSAQSPFVNKKISTVNKAIKGGGHLISLVKRGAQYFFEDMDFKLCARDEVFVLTARSARQNLLDVFAVSQNDSQHIVILGGGNIGYNVAKLIEALPEADQLSVCIVEKSKARAAEISRELSNSVVIEGSALDFEMLKEADIGRANTVLALMDDDENNILGALLAKSLKADFASVLVGNPLYPQILPTLGIDSIISPKEVTVTEVMQCLPLNHLHILHGFGDSGFFLCRADIMAGEAFLNKPVDSLNVKGKIKVSGLIRENVLLMPDEDLRAASGDVIILLAARQEMDRLKKLF